MTKPKTETVYIQCDECNHEFEVEIVDGVITFADGYRPEHTTTTGDAVFEISHLSRGGRECDSTLIVRK